MVPPAMMTDLHSFSTWAKWTAGFNSRNLTLLSDKVPGRKTNGAFYNTLISSLSFIWHCAFKTVPCLYTTTLPSVLLLVRAVKKPSTCIMGDADSTFSASTDPCWSAEGTAHVGADGTDNHNEQPEECCIIQCLLIAKCQSVRNGWIRRAWLWCEKNYICTCKSTNYSLSSSQCLLFSNMLVLQFDNNMHDIYYLACAFYKQGNVVEVQLCVLSAKNS